MRAGYTVECTYTPALMTVLRLTDNAEIGRRRENYFQCIMDLMHLVCSWTCLSTSTESLIGGVYVSQIHRNIDTSLKRQPGRRLSTYIRIHGTLLWKMSFNSSLKMYKHQNVGGRGFVTSICMQFRAFHKIHIKPLKEFYTESHAIPAHSPLVFHIKVVTRNS